MNLLETGAQMLSQKLGVDVNPQTILEALQGLLAGSDGKPDLGGLIARLSAQGGLGSIVQSWLGDGANASISPQAILDALGQGNVAQFADRVGTDTNTAANALSDVLPQIVDKASSGGNLMESAGGLGGLMGAARSFFK